MNSDFSDFPMRQIHLDFHTSPDIPDVGADWDAAHFAQTLTRARVNSVTLFATCHHGMSYYPSKVAPVHPSLNFDLLGAQIEACHGAGIRCPIYLTVAWNESAALRHPEWRQVDISGKLVGAAPTEPGWPWLCVNTGYADELIAQTEELLALYGTECDGFFYDILMYHSEGCVCVNCLRDLRNEGQDPRNVKHRRAQNHRSARRFMARSSDLIRSRLPKASIFFNSRWGLHFRDEQQYYSQVEIESLPTGGWGYAFYPLWSRYGRNFGLPMLGMTGRFHRTWADWGGLKHPDALRFECGGILANGGAVSVGDQLHPRGRLNDVVYDVIGEAYRDVEAVEAYCVGTVAEAQIGLLVLNPDADKANQSAAGIVQESSAHVDGAAKMLLELHHQFDVITDTTCSDFSRYELLVLPDRAVVTPETAERLRAYVGAGGKLLVSHEATLTEGGSFEIADLLGVDYVGPAESVPDYFVVTHPALEGPVLRSGFPYSLYEGPTAHVLPRAGTEVLADAHETYFNRTGEHFISHGFTPPTADGTAYPAATRRGGVIYFYGPLFTAYQRHGNLTFCELAGKLLDLLLPEKLVVTDAPPSTEVTVMHQPKEGRRIVHIVNYSPQRRASGHVEVLGAPVPLHNVTVRLRGAAGASRAFLARSGMELPLIQEPGTEGGRVSAVVVPRVGAHEVIVFE